MEKIDFIQKYFKDISSKLETKTISFYHEDIDNFFDFTKKNPLDIEKSDILKYIEKLSTSYSQKTIYRKLTSVRIFYKYLIKNRIIDINPFHGIKIPKESKNITKAIKGWEIKNILDICEDKRDKLMILLLVATGFKIGDILKLKKSDLEKLNYEVINVNEKGRILSATLDAYTTNMLREYCTKIDVDEIFMGLSRENFRARFIKYGKLANIERDITPTMIKKMVSVEYTDGASLKAKIKDEYMRIGIGDE